ncbi:hypothetical protein I3842_11G143900 [Carya illinoinensis]|uniref:Ycf49-like protein n=1 Tax=Carya illinoinensis TaxID=32201 RepID=A0A922DQB0_CARIL|nr:hypothetical protein I3842_11G143900 [Carya illinoinensis]
MAITTLFYLPNSLFSHKPIKAISFSTPKSQIHEPFQTKVQTRKENPADYVTIRNPKAAVALFGAGLSLSLIAPASAAELPLLGSTLQLVEPANALSLPTWAIHVSSVVEWITAMALVWQYGEQSGYESWKGLAWGMVPLLGGAFCACTWHFFYNSESLEVLVALQAALTVIGNATMCIAAFRIYKASEESSKNL